MVSRLKEVLASFSKFPFPLRWHFVVLVSAAMLPLVIFASMMVSKLAHSQRLASERRLMYETQELAAAVDREVESIVRTLEALAVSDQLRRGQLRSFHDELVLVKQTQPNWATIQLHSEQGELLITAIREFDETPQRLQPFDPKSLARVLVTGKPAVGSIIRRSDLPKKDEVSFAVRVPVLVNSRVKYILSAVIGANAIQEIVTQS